MRLRAHDLKDDALLSGEIQRGHSHGIKVGHRNLHEWSAHAETLSLMDDP
jgi:hypothetical protein